MNEDEKKIIGTCAAGFTDCCLCIGWTNEEDCCRNADCEYFVGLNSFSIEAHKSFFDESNEKEKNLANNEEEIEPGLPFSFMLRELNTYKRRIEADGYPKFQDSTGAVLAFIDELIEYIEWFISEE